MVAAVPLLAAALLSSAPVSADEQSRQAVAVPSCRQAVARSRMICITGSECQKEISDLLRACDTSDAASCVQARDDVRKQCTRGSPWYGTRECQAAVEQLAHYCGR